MAKKWTRWFKEKKVPFDQLEPHDCPNCGTEFKGYYCPNCGQSDTEFDRPFGFVIYNFMGDFFAFDSRFFLTFKYLLFKPGFLTNEFLEGRRQRYAPPFRIFIFLSFLLFLLLQVLTDAALKKPIGFNPEEKAVSTVIDSISTAMNDPELRLAMDETDSLETKVKIGLEDVLTKSTLEEKLAVFSKELDEQLKTETDPEKREDLIQMKHVVESPRAITSTILKYLSWAFFVMLPVFAVFLALLYVRRKMHFIRHLVFSVHIHSFAFLLNIFVVSFALFWHFSGWALFWAFVIIQVYIYMALHRFYRQGYLKTFFKFILLGGIYTMCISLATAYVIYNAFVSV
ncbi:DUF3667 domain-containing protein [Mangrovibacterium diazotrophicum]|uniref:Uncharacterized protein DUF3667 n=1 Tax=Mangrovibacterium diazotrophicum TaxID=1261403 RepID=A0A419W8W0_9BACT|nr:DUF3667 domain-containing protein [Mangrovibacterium diazotrophicum]RKD91864.1 uncharacterized protein DUF3667 [Mangrovibacterium diazotrophicum]